MLMNVGELYVCDLCGLSLPPKGPPVHWADTDLQHRNSSPRKQRVSATRNTVEGMIFL
jgi:hypothetical protein